MYCGLAFEVMCIAQAVRHCIANAVHAYRRTYFRNFLQCQTIARLRALVPSFGFNQRLQNEGRITKIDADHFRQAKETGVDEDME